MLPTRKAKAKKNKSVKQAVNQSLQKQEGKVILTLPIVTESEANLKEHWATSNKRHQKQKTIAKVLFRSLIQKSVTLPCHLTFIRMSPRMLDAADNLPMSMKYITDAICEELTGNYIPGRADSDERITISYGQEQIKKLYGVKVIFDLNDSGSMAIA